MEASVWVVLGIRLLGFLLILFAIIDIVSARIFSTDITGVSWSPIVSGLIGGAILRFTGGGDD
jgi:hypothetical protein